MAQENISPLRARRSIFHVFLGILVLYLAINLYSEIRWILFCVLFFGILLSLFSLRFRLPFIYFMLKKFEKPRYIKKFPGKGVLFFVAGSLLVLKLFPKTIALASIAILTFSDPSAKLFGLLIGRKRYKKPFNTLKKVEGTVIGIAVGFFAASFFVPFAEALIASALAMFTEAITLKLGGDDVDDNIIVPLAAATAMYLVVRFLGL